jgi:YbgC/YbaW family acyl-CoA thioester hydrolase
MHSSEPFCYHVRVQFDHTDAQGRVFYANYFRLIDQARCAYWEGLGLTEADVRQIEQDTVIVRVEADYRGPAEFYDPTGREIFTARMVMVQVDLASERSRPWSPAFRAAVIRHHGPQVVKA